MSLADVQRAVAELLCDARSLDAYRRDPRGWLAARALQERERRVLDGVDASSLAAFHDIHARDRGSFVEAVLPRTTARLGERWPGEYFAAFPYGADETRVEARRFVAYLAPRTDDATRALAQLELAGFLLLDARPFEAVPTSYVRESAAARLSPGLALVPTPVDVRPLMDDPHAAAPARDGVVLLRRDRDGTTTAWIEGAHAAILKAVHARDAGAIRGMLETPAGHAAFGELLLEGVLR